MKAKLLFVAMLFSAAAIAQSHVSTSGNKYVLIEEGTGAWCGYCPDGSYTLDTILLANPRVIGISNHDNLNTTRGDQTADDMMEVGTAYDFNHTTGFSGGYPSASVNRVPDMMGHVGQNHAAWSYAAHIELVKAPKFDVTLDHAYDAATSKLTVWVYAKTLTAITGKYNINAAITEDSIAAVGPGYEQHSHLFKNYSSFYYHKGTPNSDTSMAILGPSEFAHRHVLRVYLGGAFGDDSVIDDNAAINRIFVKKYTFTVPASFRKKYLHIVGMVQKWNASDVTDRAVDNAIEARFDSTATASSVSEIAGSITNLTLYPNPATDRLEIAAVVSENSPVHLSLADVFGRTVKCQDGIANNGVYSERLDISTLPAGVYLLQLHNVQTFISRKVVIAR